MAKPLVPVVAAVAAVAALDWAYAGVVRWTLRRNLARLHAGDPEPLLAGYADDVRFVFPGDSSWSADVRGKAAVRAWLERFVTVGLRFEVGDILVSGPPWATTVCILFTDHLNVGNGPPVYENRGAIVASITWGKVTAYEVHEDTQKVAAFDEYLETHGLGAGAGA